MPSAPVNLHLTPAPAAPMGSNAQTVPRGPSNCRHLWPFDQPDLHLKNFRNFQKKIGKKTCKNGPSKVAILKVYLIKRFILSDVQISVKLFAKLTVFDADRRRPNTCKCGTFYMKNRKKKVRIPRVLRVFNGCEGEVDRFGSFWKRMWFIFSSMRFRYWENRAASRPPPFPCWCCPRASSASRCPPASNKGRGGWPQNGLARPPGAGRLRFVIELSISCWKKPEGRWLFSCIKFDAD